MDWSGIMTSGNGKPIKAIKDAVISPAFLLAVIYTAGFIVLNHKFNSIVYNTLLCLDMERILQGEIWRLVTFAIYPPGLSWIWFAVSVWMILSVGWKLEKRLGKGFVFSYIVLVWLITILSDFVLYIVFHKVFWLNMSFCGFSFLLLAVFLIPQETFRLFTCIEVSAKWLTILFVFVLLLRSILKITAPEYLSVLTCLISAGIVVAAKRRRNAIETDKL